MSDERNLLVETLECMAEKSKRPADVRWVGTMNGWYAISWQEFAPLADRFYDASYGGTEVSEDLVIVGDDWWMERHEYDGSEWWEFKTLPQKTTDVKPFSECVFNGYRGIVRCMVSESD
jgi:hypothetical protein